MQYLGWRCFRAFQHCLGDVTWRRLARDRDRDLVMLPPCWEHLSLAFTNGRGLCCLHSTIPHPPPCARISVHQSPLSVAAAVLCKANCGGKGLTSLPGL